MWDVCLNLTMHKMSAIIYELNMSFSAVGVQKSNYDPLYMKISRILKCFCHSLLLHLFLFVVLPPPMKLMTKFGKIAGNGRRTVLWGFIVDYNLRRVQWKIKQLHYLCDIIDPLGSPSVTGSRDHCFHTRRPFVRPSVPNFQNLAKQYAHMARLWVWPSGSLMTPVL